MSMVASRSKRLSSDTRPLARLYARHESAVLKILGIASAIGVWQLAVAIGLVSPMVVSSPSRILVAGASYLASQQFVIDARTSGLEFVGGFGLAVIIGVALGFATGWLRRVEHFLDPLINFLYAAPRVALAPLLIIWFGIGIESKVAFIFLMSVFPIIINTAMGVHSVDGDLLDLARSLNASTWQLMRTIVFPSAVPFIVTGIRIGLGVGLIGVVVGEFVASTSGIGFTISQAASSYDVDLVFVGIIIIGTAGAMLTEALRRLERRMAKWKLH
ncbi:MAG TPA: ABC transporter permease [Stellaceae bacterium]|nr:ABC transporter permease [Stellaceae bacterium]